MSLTESRLYCRDQVVGLEVWQELVSDDLFNDFRDERHVSDWSKVAWVFPRNVRMKSGVYEQGGVSMR